MAGIIFFDTECGLQFVCLTENLLNNFVTKYTQTKMTTDQDNCKTEFARMAGRIDSLLQTDGSDGDPVIWQGVDLDEFIRDYHHADSWSTREFIHESLRQLASGLRAMSSASAIHDPEHRPSTPKTLAFVINPGAPLEGAGEILFAAVSGFRCILKLPEKSARLYKTLLEYLLGFSEKVASSIEMADGPLPRFDGIVFINALQKPDVAGYFGRWPHLYLSSSRATVILTGEESQQEVRETAAGICNFYGRSYRSIKSLKVPENYDFSGLKEALSAYHNFINHSRYFNHYEYHKSVFLINAVAFEDLGFLLLTKDQAFKGNTGVLVYEEYKPGSTGIRHSSDTGSEAGDGTAGQGSKEAGLFLEKVGFLQFLQSV